MDTIKNILINYWPQILAIILFVLSFILQCIKKKPVNDVEGFIFKLCITAIQLVEASEFKGKEKLDKAVMYVVNQLKMTFPDLDAGCYLNYIAKTIEAILSTPQKKAKNG